MHYTSCLYFSTFFSDFCKRPYFWYFYFRSVKQEYEIPYIAYQFHFFCNQGGLSDKKYSIGIYNVLAPFVTRTICSDQLVRSIFILPSSSIITSFVITSQYSPLNLTINTSVFSLSSTDFLQPRVARIMH